MSPMHEARLREVERRRLAVDHGRCLIRLRRAVQHAAPDRLEVAGRLEVPRLDQLEDPLACCFGRAAQSRPRGGELRAVRKAGHGRRGSEEGAKVGQLLGTQSALLERQLLGVLGQIVQLLPTDCGQQLGARAARAGRRRCLRAEPPVAREAGVHGHAVLGDAPVLRVALPRRQQRPWRRRGASQRHDRRAEPRPSAAHECRRAEQSERGH